MDILGIRSVHAAVLVGGETSMSESEGEGEIEYNTEGWREED